MAKASQVPISKRLVLINSVSGIATRVLTVGVFAWVIQYLMKRIPEEELALMAIVGSVAMILPLLQTILAGGLARYVTEAYARNDMAGVTRIVSSQFPFLLLGSILVLLIGGCVTWNIHHVLTIPPDLVGTTRIMLLMVVCRFALGMCLAPFNTGLFAKQKFVVQNVLDIVGSLLRIGLMLGLILVLGPKVVWVIAAQIASQVFVVVASTAVSMHHLPALRFRMGSFDWQTCKQVMTLGGWYFVLESARLIRRAADAPILNILATPIAVNDFFLGSTVETQLRELATRAALPLLPALTAMHAHQQQERLAAAFLRGGRIALWASMFLAVPLIVFSYDLFELYLGAKYPEHVAAATVMILLLVGFPFTYPTMLFIQIAHARAEIRPVAVRTVAAQLGNLVLTLLLVGPLRMGAVGSAAATLVSFVVSNPFLLWPLALRTLHISWRRFVTNTLVPGLLPTVVAVCAALISIRFTGSILTRVAIGMPVCLLAYAVALLIALRPADRADLGKIRRLVQV